MSRFAGLDLHIFCDGYAGWRDEEEDWTLGGCGSKKLYFVDGEGFSVGIRVVKEGTKSEIFGL